MEGEWDAGERETIKKIRQETGRGNNNLSFYSDKNILYNKENKMNWRQLVTRTLKENKKEL